MAKKSIDQGVNTEVAPPAPQEGVNEIAEPSPDSAVVDEIKQGRGEMDEYPDTQTTLPPEETTEEELDEVDTETGTEPEPEPEYTPRANERIRELVNKNKQLEELLFALAQKVQEKQPEITEPEAPDPLEPWLSNPDIPPEFVGTLGETIGRLEQKIKSEMEAKFQQAIAPLLEKNIELELEPIRKELGDAKFQEFQQFAREKLGKTPTLQDIYKMFKAEKIPIEERIKARQIFNAKKATTTKSTTGGEVVKEVKTMEDAFKLAEQALKGRGG